MKLVLFLGAGFSCRWNLPVMNRFFEVAAKHRRLTDADRGFLRDIQSKTRNAAGMIVSEIDDLEHVLSFALMSQDIDRQRTEGVEPDVDRLRKILAMVYADLRDGSITQSQDVFKRLLGLDRDSPWDHQLTIVTTNYDLLPEIMLKPHGFGLELPNKWKSHTKHPQAQSYYGTGRRIATLCKLHGALNWYDAGDGHDRFLIADRQVLRDKRDGTGRICLPEAYCPDFAPPSSPLLVPPSLFKMQSDSRFDAIWRCAGQAIQSADRLVFIGYSFPASDTYMKYFVAAHLAKHPRPPEIQILDPNANSICSRLKHDPLFGQHFRSLLQPLEHRWEKSGVCLLD